MLYRAMTGSPSWQILDPASRSTEDMKADRDRYPGSVYGWPMKTPFVVTAEGPADKGSSAWKMTVPSGDCDDSNRCLRLDCSVCNPPY